MLAGIRKVKRVGHDEEVPLTDHLEELRNRVFISLLALAVGFILCFWQHELIIEFLNRPLPASVPEPIVLAVTEPFMIALKVSIAGAVILALPVLIYQTAFKGYRLSEAATLSVIATAVLLVFALLTARAMDREEGRT